MNFSKSLMMLIAVVSLAAPVRAAEKVCGAEIANKSLQLQLSLSQGMTESAYGPSSKLDALPGGTTREIFAVGSVNVAAQEFSVLEGEYPVRYLFSMTNSTGEPAGTLFLASYLPVTKTAQESGYIGAHTRIFHVNFFKEGQTALLRSYRCEPSYAAVRMVAVEHAMDYASPSQALALRKANEAEYDTGVARLDGLIKAKRFDAAETEVVSLLAGTRSSYGLGTLREVGVLNQLAIAHFQRGAYRKAIAALRKGMAILEVAFGETHEHVAAKLRDIGDITFGGLKLPIDAEPLLKRAVAIYQQRSLLDSTGGEKAIRSYATTLRALGRPDDAREMYGILLDALPSDQDQTVWREGLSSGAVVHTPSGISFPLTSRNLVRNKTTTLDRSGREVSASYTGQIASRHFIDVSVFAYPRAGRNVEAAALATLHHILKKPGTTRLWDGAYSVASGNAEIEGYGGRVQMPDERGHKLIESVYVYSTGEFLVKVRLVHTVVKEAEAKENIGALMRAILFCRTVDEIADSADDTETTRER
jgi:tetratricopeptide (TPR) repeat protein